MLWGRGSLAETVILMGGIKSSLSPMYTDTAITNCFMLEAQLICLAFDLAMLNEVNNKLARIAMMIGGELLIAQVEKRYINPIPIRILRLGLCGALITK